MDNNELRFKLDEHIDNLFAKAKETDNAEDLKAITEAIDSAYKISPVEKSGSDFSWVLSLLMLANGYGIFGTK